MFLTRLFQSHSSPTLQSPRPAIVEAMEPRRLMSAMTFTLVPSKSIATLSAGGGLTVAAQSKGSLTTCYKGSILADVRPGSIQLLKGGSIIGMAETKGKPGNAPADFAAVIAGLVNAALRNLVLNLTSSKTAMAKAGTFSSKGETFKVATGKVDYAGLGGIALKGTDSLVGLFSSNQTTRAARYGVSHGIATLTIPLKITIKFAVIPSLVDKFTFTGQLVATAKAPGH